MDSKEIPAVRLNRKMNFIARGTYAALRVTHRKAYRNHMGRFKVKCGCCDQTFEIYYGDLDDPRVARLEIVDVNAGIEDWRAVLLPLLGFERQGDTWVDTHHMLEDWRPVLSSLLESER